MIKPILFVAVFLTASFAPATANAYCCWNEAICVATCGQPCCHKGTWIKAPGGGESGLGEISVKDLKAEINQCKDAAAMKGALNSEIASRRRSVRPPTQTPTAPEPPARLR